MRKRIYSGAPLEKKVGYCRATRVGDLVFVSGSVAMKDGQVVGVGDPAAQTRQAVATIEEALREAGSSMDEVVRYRLFVTNAEDFPAVLKVLSETFGGIHPRHRRRRHCTRPPRTRRRDRGRCRHRQRHAG